MFSKPHPPQFYEELLSEELKKTSNSLITALDENKNREGFDLEMQIHLKNQMARKLTCIEDALDRIQIGTFGACQRCGITIWERLEVLPYAEFCIECQRKIEANRNYVN